ncbi:hypothetical protein [Salaquimonas pukyongi]|uniref:hypothetical protein n=1 Tax=Salaquimonas pukyongi TaxID=2712698 RepID=UPI00096B9642|nr:hypothetical protein [Salaquimonas pukyongi]
MEEYSFFADLLSMFRSLNDWIKALIVASFYATIAAVLLAVIKPSHMRGSAAKPTSIDADELEHRQRQPQAVATRE